VLEFFTSAADSSTVWMVILLTGVVTYITRSAGHMVLARFDRIHPRVEAALEAVPAAVLITIVLPPAMDKGALEVGALVVAFALSLRFSPIAVLAAGLALVVMGRLAGL